MRAHGSSPSPSTRSTSAGAGSPSSASLKRSCTSRSAGMSLPLWNVRDDLIGLVSLPEQHVELREVRVPLDERRDRAESLERLSIEPPDGGRHRRAVIVDQDGQA